MGRSLAYTLNISSSSKSLEKSRSYTLDTPATLYDRRERVPNIMVLKTGPGREPEKGVVPVLMV